MRNSRTSRKDKKTISMSSWTLLSQFWMQKLFEKNLDTLLLIINGTLFPHKKSRKSIEWILRK